MGVQLMPKQECLVDYDVVSEFAGHQKNRQVAVIEAAEDIFKRVKEKAMQCAVKGEFIEFNTIAQLKEKLKNAVSGGYSIRVFDENVGG